MLVGKVWGGDGLGVGEGLAENNTKSPQRKSERRPAFLAEVSRTQNISEGVARGQPRLFLSGRKFRGSYRKSS